MGKRVIINGADFSQNCIPTPKPITILTSMNVKSAKYVFDSGDLSKDTLSNAVMSIDCVGKYAAGESGRFGFSGFYIQVGNLTRAYSNGQFNWKYLEAQRELDSRFNLIYRKPTTTHYFQQIRPNGTIVKDLSEDTNRTLDAAASMYGDFSEFSLDMNVGEIDFYGAKILYNDALYYDFVPALDGDGNECIYERVNGKLFYAE